MDTTLCVYNLLLRVFTVPPQRGVGKVETAICAFLKERYVSETKRAFEIRNESVTKMLTSKANKLGAQEAHPPLPRLLRQEEFVYNKRHTHKLHPRHWSIPEQRGRTG